MGNRSWKISSFSIDNFNKSSILKSQKHKQETRKFCLRTNFHAVLVKSNFSSQFSGVSFFPPISFPLQKRKRHLLRIVYFSLKSILTQNKFLWIILGSAIDGALTTPCYRFNRTTEQSSLRWERPAGLELWFICCLKFSSGQLVAYSELDLHLAQTLMLGISREATTIDRLVGWLNNNQMLTNISPGQMSLWPFKESFSSEEPFTSSWK